MRKLSIVLFLIAFLAAYSSASALVISFDDVATPASSTVQLASNYGGFNWSTDFGLISDTRYNNHFGNSYGATSASNAAFNYSGIQTATVTSADIFDFSGAYFSSLSNNNGPATYSATSITVEGYNNGALVGSVLTSLSNSSYNWLQVDLFGIDELRFISSSSGNWWLMDDFTYAYADEVGNSNVAPVPEPSTILLLGLGCLGIFGYGKRKLKR